MMITICPDCLGSGVIETTTIKHGKPVFLNAKCQTCKDDKSYSQTIKIKFGNDDDETQQEKVNRLIGGE